MRTGPGDGGLLVLRQRAEPGGKLGGREVSAVLPGSGGGHVAREGLCASLITQRQGQHQPDWRGGGEVADGGGEGLGRRPGEQIGRARGCAGVRAGEHCGGGEQERRFAVVHVVPFVPASARPREAIVCRG